jgi:hypothetical protein
MRLTTAIVREMAKRKLSEQDLAMLANVTLDQVHFFLRSSLKTELRTVAAIASALGHHVNFSFEADSVLDKMLLDPNLTPDGELKRVLRL